MKATLEFNLPDDSSDFYLATHGQDMYSILWELDQFLRSKTKYAPDDMSDDTYKAYEDARNQLYELMQSSSFNFDGVN